MKTLIIIPTYNERENIKALAEQITIVNAEFHVLVVDDNSPDGTGSLVQSLGEKNCRIRLREHSLVFRTSRPVSHVKRERRRYPEHC
jgi:glycosyltransferase involved in cell wall biosynthesis